MDDKIEKLRWVRVFSSVHIPKYLVEQVRDREFSVEDFYKYQELNCLIQTEKGPTLNPLNHLYVLVDEENIVKGFLWFIIDPLSKDMVVHTFSMDEEYWGGGKAMKRASEHVKDVMKKLKLKKVYWITNYPKHSERNGFKRARGVLMEYKEEEDGKRSKGIPGGNNSGDEFKNADGRTEAGERHQHVDSRATAVI